MISSDKFYLELVRNGVMTGVESGKAPAYLKLRVVCSISVQSSVECCLQDRITRNRRDRLPHFTPSKF